MPVDVRALGCDWLSGTARKYLRGPRGVGFLFASRHLHACCSCMHVLLFAHGAPCVTQLKDFLKYIVSCGAKVLVFAIKCALLSFLAHACTRH